MANPENEKEDSEPNSRGVVWNRRARIAVALVIVLAAASVLTAFALHAFDFGRAPGNQRFSIVMTSQGFNGSVAHYPNPWPIINVHKGDNVTIRVQNADSTGEPHGFAIVHYFNGGFALAAGQSDEITFTANQTGTFTVYCYIFCTIHTYMQAGQLRVT